MTLWDDRVPLDQETKVVEHFNQLGMNDRAQVWKYMRSVGESAQSYLYGVDVRVLDYVRTNFINHLRSVRATPSAQYPGGVLPGIASACKFIDNNRQKVLAWMALQGFNVKGLA